VRYGVGLRYGYSVRPINQPSDISRDLDAFSRDLDARCEWRHTTRGRPILLVSGSWSFDCRLRLPDAYRFALAVVCLIVVCHV